MRQLFLSVIAIAMALPACEKDDQPTDPYTTFTVAMGSNSLSDVYYSLANGEVNTINRSDWDIAFSVPLQTATVLINEGAGVELFCVGDTGDWSIVDENSIDGISPRYNDKSNWFTGAFNVNASGFPNYGWGTYHFGNPDHNVGGDSLYVIKLSDGSLKKLMIRAKLGMTAASVIRWANLDGSDESIDTIPTAGVANTRHFVYYSLTEKSLVEAEPDKSAWDLLFTRYVIQIPTGPGVFMNYPVMGVLSNPDVTVAEVTGVEPPSASDADAPGGYSDAADVIGYDWKVSDPVTHEITLVDQTSYFIQTVDGTKYQLYFTRYGGNASGTIDFKVKPIE
jgi:hypothetical protein